MLIEVLSKFRHRTSDMDVIDNNPTDTRPTVIDLFSGAGGLTGGLEAAGWRTIATVDCNADSVETLRRTRTARIPIPHSRYCYLEGAILLEKDIAEVSAADLRPKGANSRWRPDLLVGGPPCQPFSSSGLMRSLEDPRGRLFLHFVRLAQELRPRFVLFENVAGLVTAKSLEGKPGGVLRLVQRAFERIGYACRFELLNAADYGAAQRRVRLYMIGSRGEELPPFPVPTHGRLSNGALDDRKPWRTLEGFLAQQPEPLESEIVRPSANRSTELASLRPGTGLRALGIVEANRPGGHWGYRQDCFVADVALPSRTIRAASTPDWIRSRDGSLRRLTWRECAGLQGFPPRWPFYGTLASRFRQIGNAVQSDVAVAIGRTLFEAAARTRRRTNVLSLPWPPSFHKRVRYTAMEEIVNGEVRAAARLGLIEK